MSLQDLRFAWRTLRKSPGFSLIAVVILGVGIGGIAGSFSIVLAFTLALSIVTTLAFALLPALQASKVNLVQALKQTTSTPHRASYRSRNLMVVVQVASAFVLLVGTVLMVRTVSTLQQVSLGFEPQNVLTMGTHLTANQYPENRDKIAFHSTVTSRIGDLPGVVSASFVYPLPMNFATAGRTFEVEGRTPQSENERLQARSHYVSPQYFETMKMSLLRGRPLGESDDLDAPRIVVANESFTNLYWPGKTGVGKRIRWQSSGAEKQPEWMTIVGVVGDSKNLLLNEDNIPILYISQLQNPTSSAFLAVRTTGDPHASFAMIADSVWQLHPNLPLSEVRSMEEVIEASMLPWQATVGGLTALAGLAVFLATLGIYGVLSHAVASRTAEIGVRRAMGATLQDVIRLVVRQGGRLVATGLLTGLVLSILLNRFLSSLLFGVGSLDLTSYLMVFGALILAAILAIAVPVLRAWRIDPMIALRYE